MIGKIDQLMHNADNQEAQIPIGQWNIPKTIFESIPTISRRDFFAAMILHAYVSQDEFNGEVAIETSIRVADKLIKSLDDS